MGNDPPVSQADSPLPGWVGSAVQVIAQLGIPTVFATVLLWFVLSNVSDTLKHIEHAEVERTKLLAGIEESFVAAINKQSEQNARLYERLIERDCVGPGTTR
jgi:hypothetical protein